MLVAEGSSDNGRPVPDEYCSVTVSVSVEKSESRNFIEVQPNLLLKEIRPLGIYLKYNVENVNDLTNNTEPSSLSGCVFHLLMSNAKKNSKVLPDKLSEMDNLRKLKNKLRDFLATYEVVWNIDSAEKVLKQ